LKEIVASVGAKLTANNYSSSKKRLAKAIADCREIGFEISDDDESQYMADLKADYEKMVRLQLEREEQARIKAQIREEQRIQKEIDRELEQIERERAAIQKALDKALAEAEDEHAAEVEALRAKLKEAEERSERTKSRAEMTRSGHVYVISNIGSFGEDIYKIGMTRRLEPNDRVRELSSASVPFPFDVHMMISSDDAPSLENALHRELRLNRVNRANPRKEFFRVTLDEIISIVEEKHGEVDYVADPEALEYLQTLEMPEEDSEYIQSVYGDADEDDD
jgi:multidrug efflux pump subunit AcrA (membrane-fusion protein)